MSCRLLSRNGRIPGVILRTTIGCQKFGKYGLRSLARSNTGGHGVQTP